MAKLAIKGHPKRGNEVIEILEMLGGSNPHNYCADCDSLCFTIGKGTNIIYYDWVKECYEDEDTLVFSLEEFLEKFPYKVGDKVLYKIYGIYSRIKSMLWNVEKEQVFYRLDSNKLFVATADELKPRKEETMEDKLEQITFDIPNGYEFFGINDDNQVVLAKKQPQYPKTYIECAKSLECFGAAHIDGYKCELLEKLQELLICRDAYWKIAGEQMELGKPWDSRYGCGEWGYWIGYSVIENKIDLQDSRILVNHILVFPTEEMRDVFYENFKELIEQCKELL